MTAMDNLIKHLRANGVKVIDRRGQANGGNPRDRSMSDITTGALHWDGVNGSIEGHENHWRNTMGWNLGGYHIFFPREKTAIVNYDFETTTNGVGNNNSYTAHFSYAGSPSAPMTAEQREVIKLTWDWVKANTSMKQLRGHNEFPGHASNQCPGVNMNVFRNELEKATIPTQKAVVTVEAGDTLWGIANAYNVTVDQLKNWNNLSSNVINVGQKLKLKEHETETVPVPTQPKFEQLAIDGSFGPATTRRLQQVLGTQVTGVIGGQSRHSVTKNIHSVQFGTGGSMVVREMQRRLNVTVDGSFGPQTLRALQRRMGTPVTGAISPSGSAVVMELQRRLNRNTF